jgi:hypothetical protein
MTNEQLAREVAQKLEASAVRATDAERRRIAALLKAPGGEKLAAELKKYAGLEALLAALNGWGKRPDADKQNPYDKIRQDVARKHAPHPDESIPLEQRLLR